jgi:antitoxin component HigA of HigAB toxin-antitoxin module
MSNNSEFHNIVNLTTLDEMLGSAQHDVMPPDINQEWFKERLRQIKMSQRQLAKKIGLDPASVSYMFSGKRRMTMEEAKVLASHLLVPVTEVMRQAGIEVQDDVRKVPVAGYIGAGGVVTLLPNGTHDYVMAPADTPDGSFALQVRRVDSPRDGWLCFVSGSQQPPAQCLDKLCIVALKDGGLLCAVVRRGYKRDLYNLILMYEALPNVLENKEVTWGARIVWIQPT